MRKLIALLTFATITSLGALVLAFMGPAEEEPIQGTSPSGSFVQVQSASAWYYTDAMCSSGLRVGDWLQHYYRDGRKAHRSVKVSQKYQHNSRIYVNIRKVEVTYRNRHQVRTESHGIYPIFCYHA